MIRSKNRLFLLVFLICLCCSIISLLTFHANVMVASSGEQDPLPTEFLLSEEYRPLVSSTSKASPGHDMAKGGSNSSSTLPVGISSGSVVKNEKSDASQTAERAALCAMVKDEEPYIDEWLDYHFGLGFDSVFVYDNSDDFVMKNWAKKRSKVEVKHYPGTFKQRKSYDDCVETFAYNHTWVGFLDVDEFLVLKKHENVVDFLREHCERGALAINWYIFGTGNKTIYEPLPVTKRFQYREGHVDNRTKVVVRVQDFDKMINPHAGVYKNKAQQRDTQGNIIRRKQNRAMATNDKGTADVAIIHHYRYKSDREWYHKGCIRGRVTGARTRCNETAATGTVFDDSAWQVLKKNAPKYRVFDDWR